MLGPNRGARWIVESGITRHWLGLYELRKQIALSRSVRQEMCIYDIGAHAGFYSLLASRLVGPCGHVYSFEPAPQNAEYLRAHISLNNLTNVTVMEAAISHFNGKGTFNEGINSYQGTISRSGQLSVQVYTLDYLINHRLVRPADGVKIDVEGAEHSVLVGGRRFFQTHRPVVFIATHSPELRDKCLDLLRSWGYEVDPIPLGVKLEMWNEFMCKAG